MKDEARVRQLATEVQPPPVTVPGAPAVKDVMPQGTASLPTLKLALQARLAFGFEKYGTYLRTSNGRDAHCDLTQELLDAVFYDGDLSTLQRQHSPPEELLCNGYLVDLVPQRIGAVPSVSIAEYRKSLRRHVDENTVEVDGESGDLRRIYLGSDLCWEDQIGQLLGFANAADERENLYRQVVLARLDKRRLVYSDYWGSMAEYEAYIEQWRDHKQLVEMYQGMRDDVVWLTSNRDMISGFVDEWRLLLRLDSNSSMDLNINDADPLYVFIRHEDLANRNFANLAGEVTQG